MGDPSMCRNFEEWTPAKIFCAATLEGVAVSSSLLATVGVAAAPDTGDLTSSDLLDELSYINKHIKFLSATKPVYIIRSFVCGTTISKQSLKRIFTYKVDKIASGSFYKTFNLWHKCT